MQHSKRYLSSARTAFGSSLIYGGGIRPRTRVRNVWTLSPLVEEANKVSLWRCERFFMFNEKEPPSPIPKGALKEAMILVNGEIPNDHRLVSCWNAAQVRICADGGANQLYSVDKDKYTPDHIVGDLDSSNKEVLEHYKKKGVAVIHNSDQNSTDLQKALNLLKKIETLPHGVFDTITILGGIGGDFSHEMANVNAVYQVLGKKAMLLSPANLAFVLPKGKHLIRIHRRILAQNLAGSAAKAMDDNEEANAESIDAKWSPPSTVFCSLLPIGEKCTNVSTKGLRWDLNNQVLEFGGMVSSSNEFLHNVAEIETSHPLLWNFDFRKK